MLQIILLVLNFANAQSVILKESIDPREVTLPDAYKFYSEIQAQRIKERNLRPEIISTSALYLQNEISEEKFIEELNTWGNLGFNDQERNVLIDTLNKKNLKTAIHKKWTCRLEKLNGCATQKFESQKLPSILQKYEWLAIDGKTYPRLMWDEIDIPSENLAFIFLSSRFETYTFNGKWNDLKMTNPTLRGWVEGNCDKFNVSPEVQSLDTNIMLNRNCFKSSIPKPQAAPSFYAENKKWIWIAAGIVAGASAMSGLSGKSIVLEKPSFK